MLRPKTFLKVKVKFFSSEGTHLITYFAGWHSKAFNNYFLHRVLIDIFSYDTMTKITSVLIKLTYLYWFLRFFIEGGSSFYAPQPTLKINGPIKLQRGSGTDYYVRETSSPKWRLNRSIKFRFLNFDNIFIKIDWREYYLFFLGATLLVCEDTLLMS